MLVRNEEIFLIERYNDADTVIVYVPLRSFLAVVKKEFAEAIMNDNTPVVDAFFEHLYTKNLINPYELHNVVTRIIPQLSIPITNNCNLRCKYCYFRAGDADKCQKQTKEEIKCYVDAYLKRIDEYDIRNKEDYVDVSIAGGGEPTVEFDTFKFAVLYCEEAFRQKGLIPRFSMPTNGAYGDKVRSFITEHFFQVSMSMDGPKFIQDKHRPLANGGSSYSLVYDTVKYYYEHKLPFAFRATVSSYSVNYLKEILDFFNTEFPGKTVGLEPMNLFGRAIGNSELCPPDEKLYSEKLLEAYDYAYSKNIPIKTAGTGKFDRLRTVFCGAVGIPNWTITTEGRITSCTRDNLPDIFSFGRYDAQKNEIIIDEKKIAELRKMTVFHYPECQDCFCKYNCAGDCPDLRVSQMLNCEATRKVATYVFNKKCDEQ
jgi:radical SAM protein with 4Fe4S-binding SPASM domain